MTAQVRVHDLDLSALDLEYAMPVSNGQAKSPAPSKRKPARSKR